MDNQIKIIQCNDEDGYELAELRARAMKPSLESLGRFSEERVRSRFLNKYRPEQTFKIESEEKLAGFYGLRYLSDHIFLDHLYLDPSFQGKRLGGFVLNEIKKIAVEKDFPIKLNALKQSPANDFYKSQGFVHTHDDEFDHYYIWEL